MAVYTAIDERSLDAFLAAYDIGPAVQLQGIAQGVENSNYVLLTERGRYIPTLYERRVEPADLPFFLGLMDHLAARGVPCPTPVHGRDGEALRSLCGRPAAVVSFLEGISPHRIRGTHCAALGAALAHLHLAGAGFQMARANALSVSGWRRLFESCRADADCVMPGLEAEIDRELVEIEEQWPDDLPHGVIHADLFPDNVFFLADKLSGLIDFPFSCNDMLAYDVAICLNAWCFEPDHSFNVTKARALLNAYGRERQLSDTEQQALPLLARGAALRFLLTRLVDFLNVPPGALVKPKDPLEYVRKLRFHQNVASVRDYGLTQPGCVA
jgi:homoserine kinase type II